MLKASERLRDSVGAAPLPVGKAPRPVPVCGQLPAETDIQLHVRKHGFIVTAKRIPAKAYPVAARRNRG